MKTKAFIMMHKPICPIRETDKRITYPLYVSNGESLGTILEYFSAQGITNASKIYISIERGSWGYDNERDPDEVQFSARRSETDDEFAFRMLNYKGELEEYKKWYATHEEELERRRIEKSAKVKAAAERSIENRRKALEKELAAINKKLGKM
jgi:hypothetical protein